jgi:6-phosphogluconolactonase
MTTAREADFVSPRVLIFPPEEWARCSADLIQASIESVSRERTRCSVMLTGGRSAAALYGAWSQLLAFNKLPNVDFYIGDERCVPPDSPESNSGLVMSTLFAPGVPPGCRFFIMDSVSDERESAARQYENILPNKLDVLLLSVGEDGHIASLFPGSDLLWEKKRRVAPISGPKYPWERLTITPPVIGDAGSVFLLAQGERKAKVLSRVLEGSMDTEALPVGLAMNATWLLDVPIAERSRVGF